MRDSFLPIYASWYLNKYKLQLKLFWHSEHLPFSWMLGHLRKDEVLPSPSFSPSTYSISLLFPALLFMNTGYSFSLWKTDLSFQICTKATSSFKCICGGTQVCLGKYPLTNKGMKKKLCFCRSQAKEPGAALGQLQGDESSSLNSSLLTFQKFSDEWGAMTGFGLVLLAAGSSAWLLYFCACFLKGIFSLGFWSKLYILVYKIRKNAVSRAWGGL